RAGSGARLVVKWEGKTLVDEAIDIPPASPVRAGPAFRPDPTSRVRDLSAALATSYQTLSAVEDELGQTAWYTGGWHGRGLGERPLLGQIPALAPESLGSASFRETHHTRWAYVAGAMAGGIASADLVIAMAKADLLGFFGAGGLPLPAVEESVARMAKELEGRSNWGCNLLNNPHEPAVEAKTVDLYLKYGVRRVSASAYMGLSPAVVRYRLAGLRKGADGQVICDNHVLAKVSRPEVAEKFLRPAPQALIDELVQSGAITAEQGEMAVHVPIACDITAEGDSGGHTDHRPLLVLLPILQSLRDQIAAEQIVKVPLRVGAAGGLGTPAALWAAFAMGADYVLTGSVNQATVEAGTSPIAKAMLAEAAYTDVASGPAPDMFEMGAKVQVLSRGSMYARRAQLLYDIYKAYPSMEAIPEKEKKKVEKQILQRPMAEVWEGTRTYWADRDPRQVAKAEAEPRHKMALTFRWYLGMTSRWARIGDDGRKRDYQVWCGPAMGGFNSWAEGGDLQALNNRGVVEVADALMNGAAAEARRSVGRSLGLL
ncbi:MAG: PfaD family polyunsaturated fatty acid/polyketide biosynthesis protein, partial [Myxococcota bacterium]